MAKSVLGNDPFIRGAALRPPPEAPLEKAPGAPTPVEVKAAASKRQGRGFSRTARAAPPASPSKAEPLAAKATAPDHAASSAPPEGVWTEVKPSPPQEPHSRETALAPVSSSPLNALGKVLSLTRNALGHALSSPGVGAALTTASGLYRAVAAGLGASGPVELDIYGKDERLGEDLSVLGTFLYERYWRVKVEGASNLPKGPCILVANHAGALPLDGPVLSAAIRRERPDLREPRWLVEDQVFHAPFFGTLFNRMGAVRACPENALRLLSEERPVLVFPEGIQGISKTFKDRYRLKRFGRGGFAKIAVRAGVPIVPVAIVGSEEALPLLAKLPTPALGLPYLPITPLGPLPLPSRWFIRFGAPLQTKVQGKHDEGEDLARSEELADRTRSTIERMLGELRTQRGSAYRS